MKGLVIVQLIFADIETIDKTIEKHEKLARNKIKESVELMSVLPKVKKHLEEFKLLKTLDLTDDEKQILKNYQLLTLKPMIFAANVAEDDLATGNKYVESVKEFAKNSDDSDVVSGLIAYTAHNENEIYTLDYSNRFTAQVLYRLDYKWPVTDDRYLESAIEALDRLAFFG